MKISADLNHKCWSVLSLQQPRT